MLLISFLYLVPCLISILTAVDVLVKLKRPYTVKWIILSILLCNFIVCSQEVFFLRVAFINKTTISLTRTILYVLTFILFHYFSHKKITRRIFFIAAAVFSLITLSTISKIYISKGSFTSSTLTLPEYLYLSGILILAYNYIQVSSHLISSYRRENLYSKKMKIWTIFLFILLLSALIINVLNRINIIQHDSELGHFINALIHLIVGLIYLYRPAFTNDTNFDILLGPLFTETNKEEINTHLFEHELNLMFKNADIMISIDYFAKKTGCSVEALKNYIQETYDLTFIELLNKKRVEYLIELIKNEKYSDYTLDVIGKIAGFGSRSSMNRAFKKFHGGAPSDLMRVYQNNHRITT